MTPVFSPVPVSGQSIPDAIARQLSASIQTGRLRPGDRLPNEQDLARAFNVAPMTLRTALASLRELKLLETVRGRSGGTYVCADAGIRLRNIPTVGRFSAREIRDLTDWRRAISGEASYLAAERATRESAAAIDAASRAFDDAPEDAMARRTADSRLHVLVAEMSGSDQLLQQEIAIQSRLDALLLPMPLTGARSKRLTTFDHANLSRAIAERDAESARKVAIAHVESTFAWCMTLLHPGEGASA